MMVSSYSSGTIVTILRSSGTSELCEWGPGGDERSNTGDVTCGSGCFPALLVVTPEGKAVILNGASKIFVLSMCEFWVLSAKI